MAEMSARLEWKGAKSFEGVSGSGHTVMMDGDREKGASPMKTLLLGMGGCTSVDVIFILERMRAQVTGCVAEIQAIRADEDPKVFTKIHVHFIVTGTGLTESKVARAVELSATKYCSASIMLGKTAEITHDFEIRSAGA
jgi:putative redox protein